MCGIAGIIALHSTSGDITGAARRMNDTLRHRGPDGEGYLLIDTDSEVPAFGKETPESITHSSILHKPLQALENSGGLKGVLAHRRLSIIDITPTGYQPLCNKAKTLWIVCNGEIYNYIELREELAGKGHQFHTASDTEVILAAYAEWGHECVNRFNGMWAFVIYDKDKKQLFASRDRFGVKPFYYCKNETTFAFASEQKALLAGEFPEAQLHKLGHKLPGTGPRNRTCCANSDAGSASMSPPVATPRGRTTGRLRTRSWRRLSFAARRRHRPVPFARPCPASFPQPPRFEFRLLGQTKKGGKRVSRPKKNLRAKHSCFDRSDQRLSN